MRWLLISICSLFWICEGICADNELRPASIKELDVKGKLEVLCKQATEEKTSRTSKPYKFLSESPAYQAIIALGPPCVPYLMEKIRNEDTYKWNFVYTTAAILKIEPGPTTKGSSLRLQKYIESKLASGYREAEDEFKKLKAEWLEERGEEETPELWKDITVLNAEFKVLRTHREPTPLGEVYGQIRGLGIFVLPSLIKDLENGNYDFLPIICHLTDGKAPTGRGYPREGAKACIEWWAKNKEHWTIRPSVVTHPTQSGQ